MPSRTRRDTLRSLRRIRWAQALVYGVVGVALVGAGYFAQFHLDAWMRLDGARLVAIDIDSPPQHAAMIEKLRLPFPMLSDEDRSALIEPWGLANPTDRRNLAMAAVVIITPGGEEAFRWVSREFAFRLPEDDLLGVLRKLELEPEAEVVFVDEFRIGLWDKLAGAFAALAMPARRLAADPEEVLTLIFTSGSTGVSYWEGPVLVRGDASGRGYVELTGYAIGALCGQGDLASAAPAARWITSKRNDVRGRNDLQKVK